MFSRSLLGEFGEELEREFKRMTVRYPVGGALVDLQNHINLYPRRPNPVAEKKAPIPTDPRVLSRHLKCLGHFLGADIVGIGRLPQSAVYSRDMKGREIDAPYPWAIALVVRKHEPTLCASNGWEEIVDGASFQAYQRVALQSEVMANYIRRLGWNAVATNMNSYVTLMPQIALECGIGEVSRMGIVLNPFLGANFKIAAVLTDMELEADGYADFGLQEYCESCTVCAEQCPSHAITRGKQTLHNGYSTWKLNDRVCSDFDILNKEGCVCGRCTKVCPWHRPHMDGRDFAGVGRRPRLAARDRGRAAGAQRGQRVRRPQRAHGQVVVRARRGRRRARRPDRPQRAEDLPGVPAAARLSARESELVVRHVERVAQREVSGLEAAPEPARALGRGAVRERVRDHVALRRALEAVVADGRGGPDGLLHVPGLHDVQVAPGVVRPHAGEEVRLQLEPHRRAGWPASCGTRCCRSLTAALMPSRSWTWCPTSCAIT